jgi:hypothetical protein
MAINDPARDLNNPPSNRSGDFERFTFGELEVGELFWQTAIPGDNIPWRKENQTQAKNIRKQTVHTFSAKAVVWQKT